MKQIKYIEPELFEIDKNNNHVILDDAIATIQSSILEIGQIDAIKVNKFNGRVLGGNTRLLALQIFNKHNPNNQMKIKVEFFNFETKSLEDLVAELDNGVYKEEREVICEDIAIIEFFKEIKDKKKNKIPHNGKLITNVNVIVAEVFGIAIKRVEKIITKHNNQKKNS